MRANVLFALLLCSLPIRVGAETAWESYIRAPSPAAAALVSVSEYSKPDADYRQLEMDLAILEYEVAAGEREAIRLAVRLRQQWKLAAHVSEYLSEIIGRAIRVNPTEYLRTVSGIEGCPAGSVLGDLFVDRDNARASEHLARINALTSVSEPALRSKRDECIAVYKENK